MLFGRNVFCQIILSVILGCLFFTWYLCLCLYFFFIFEIRYKDTDIKKNNQKQYINANIKITKFFHKVKYNLKGHIRPLLFYGEVALFYLNIFTSKFSSLITSLIFFLMDNFCLGRIIYHKIRCIRSYL